MKLNDFYHKYTMYSPIIFWVLSLIIFYILAFIKLIFRLRFLTVTIIIYLITYWFFFFVWIDLLFLESRIAEFSNLIINTFWYPVLISSSIIILLIIVLSFINTKKTIKEDKKKKEKTKD